MWVATHSDDARHKRSYVSIEIDNEPGQAFIPTAEIFLPMTSFGSLLQTDSETFRRETGGGSSLPMGLGPCRLPDRCLARAKTVRVDTTAVNSGALGRHADIRGAHGDLENGSFTRKPDFFALAEHLNLCNLLVQALRCFNGCVVHLLLEDHEGL